jgi:hypothetical protein
VRVGFPKPASPSPGSPTSCAKYSIVGEPLINAETTIAGRPLSAFPAKSGLAMRCSSWFSRIVVVLEEVQHVFFDVEHLRLDRGDRVGTFLALHDRF